MNAGGIGSIVLIVLGAWAALSLLLLTAWCLLVAFADWRRRRRVARRGVRRGGVIEPDVCARRAGRGKARPG